MKIQIALPTDGYIHHKVVGTLFASILNNTKHEINTVVSSMKGIGEHRNVLVKDFLKGDCDYLVMVDADNPPPTNFLDLIDLDKEVIGLPTPINMDYIQGLTNVCWNIFKDGLPVKEKGDGLQEVEAVGSGVIIIRRDVLEKIEHPFTTVRNADDLRIVGTDIAFCKRCRDKGIKIWTNWDYKCSHFKELDISTLCY